MMKWLKPDTVTKKCGYLILGSGIIMSLIIQAVMPSVFYSMMRSYISQNVTHVLRANAISQSYIWRGNKVVFNLSDDQEAMGLISAYYSVQNEKARDAVAERILQKLETQYLGYASHQVAGDGAIVATSYPIIYTEKGDIFYRATASDEVEVLLESDWLSNLGPEHDMIYSPVLGDDEMQVISFVVPFSAEGIQCYAIHLMDFAYLHVLFEELEEMGIQDYCMFQHEDVLYQNTDHIFDFESYPESMLVQLQYQTSVLYADDGMDFITLISYEGENLKLAVYAEKEVLLEPYERVLVLFEWLIISIILLLVVVISLFVKHQLNRLTVLSHRIEHVIEGKYMPLPPDVHKDEIGSLTDNFNRMLETIQADIDRRIMQEKKEQQMQYSLLVSAIDPHFIYNTLNVVTFLAHMGKTQEIVQVNTALIGTLKDRLAIKNCKTYDTIASEREVLSQYMLIQSYLCHNTIDYSFEVEKESEELLVPKNVIQPLVENSIKHGLLPHKDPEKHVILDGRIQIQVKRKENALQIIVADNGIGLSEENAQRYFTCPVSEIIDEEAEHVGICNIRKRLSYLYEDEYELKATNTPGGGCTIILRLPINVYTGKE